MITALPALDAARDAARSEVHKRALKAGAKAAEPLGLATSIWGETVTDLITDIQDIFQLTPEQRTAIEPQLLHGLGELITHYAPATVKAGTLATVMATLRGSSLARKAANGVAARAATRIGGRVARHAGAGGMAARAVLRRAWVVPLALGGGTGALYEVLGRRCINACYDHLHAAIASPAPATINAPA
ncbi:hypothetical protein [Sphingomonas prati]|uniref:Uncharacterized protein n=1 Tax=Sphingomonas prati TaxID=1843237 RepID=A0A7W9BSW7_9SPHN|nr:hypothetical protein [Sphingomonas prati]MBB5729416.1 hypothetical protein [Sphingomonas prati]GGE77606.1 hypothetical protein GCM10011404_07880 [Sphingomonas prati]